MSKPLELYSRICRRCDKQFKITSKKGLYCSKCKKPNKGHGYNLCKCGNRKYAPSKICSICFRENKNRKVSRILNREKKREVNK